MLNGSGRLGRTQAGRGQCGFTYIGLLLFVAMMGAALAGTGVLYRTQVQREKEKELLFIGDQFRRAIMLYYEQSPGGDKRYPKSLDDLLRDNRYPGAQRYLRRVYADPMTGTTDWGLLRADGGISGVYSLSEGTPMKTARFPSEYEQFTGKTSYTDWVFAYAPPAPAEKKDVAEEQDVVGEKEAVGEEGAEEEEAADS